MFGNCHRALLAAVTFSAALFAAPAESHAIFHNWFGHGSWFGHGACCSAPTTTYRPIVVPSACNTCTPYTASYAPVTYYRPLFSGLRPWFSGYRCNSCPTTVMRPTTSYHWPQFTTASYANACPTACDTCPTTPSVTYAAASTSIGTGDCCTVTPSPAQSTFSSQAPAANYQAPATSTGETPQPTLAPPPTPQQTLKPAEQGPPPATTGQDASAEGPQVAPPANAPGSNTLEPQPHVDPSSTRGLFRVPEGFGQDRVTQRTRRAATVRPAVHVEPASARPSQEHRDAQGWRPARR